VRCCLASSARNKTDGVRRTRTFEHQRDAPAWWLGSLALPSPLFRTFLSAPATTSTPPWAEAVPVHSAPCWCCACGLCPARQPPADLETSRRWAEKSRTTTTYTAASPQICNFQRGRPAKGGVGGAGSVKKKRTRRSLKGSCALQASLPPRCGWLQADRLLGTGHDFKGLKNAYSQTKYQNP
jgi:hypothetical protein